MLVRCPNANVDAADALVLGEALASHADIFITGDAALLRLAAVGTVKIVSPRGFWDVLRAGNESLGRVGPEGNVELVDQNSNGLRLRRKLLLCKAGVAGTRTRAHLREVRIA